MTGRPSGKTRRCAPAPARKDEAIAAGARRHAKAALAALVEVMSDPEASPAARISAASAVLSWAFGRKAAEESDTQRPAEIVIRWLKPGEGGRGRSTR